MVAKGIDRYQQKIVESQEALDGGKIDSKLIATAENVDKYLKMVKDKGDIELLNLKDSLGKQALLGLNSEVVSNLASKFGVKWEVKTLDELLNNSFIVSQADRYLKDLKWIWKGNQMMLEKFKKDKEIPLKDKIDLVKLYANKQNLNYNESRLLNKWIEALGIEAPSENVA